MNKLNVDFNQFNECKLLITDLQASLHGIEMNKNDPASFIGEQFLELRMQVDTKREVLMLEIQNHSEKLIEAIEMAERECLTALKAKESKNVNFSDYKAELDEINNVLDSFNIDGNCQEILEKSKELKHKMEPIMEEYREQLLGNQTFEFIAHDISIETIFGSFEIREVSDFFILFLILLYFLATCFRSKNYVFLK